MTDALVLSPSMLLGQARPWVRHIEPRHALEHETPAILAVNHPCRAVRSLLYSRPPDQVRPRLEHIKVGHSLALSRVALQNATGFWWALRQGTVVRRFEPGFSAGDVTLVFCPFDGRGMVIVGQAYAAPSPLGAGG
jgi:hypothetical protein